MTGVRDVVSDLLGVAIYRWRRLAGGDLSAVARLHTEDGRSFVAKAGSAMRVEAEMLDALARAGAPVPKVIAASDTVLILEDLGDDAGPANAWADLGRVLKRLHATTGPAPGWSCDHAFGPVAIANATTADWPSFWADRRLLPMCPECPTDLARRIETLARRLPDRLPARPHLSLLHGDLWTGNVMARGGKITGLIDPACYFGHAEVDLAMLTLFGRPGPGFWSTYGAMEPDADVRRPIYQLWPALVHLRLFGGAYRGLVEQCLDQSD